MVRRGRRSFENIKGSCAKCRSANSEQAIQDQTPSLPHIVVDMTFYHTPSVPYGVIGGV